MTTTNLSLCVNQSYKLLFAATIGIHTK